MTIKQSLSFYSSTSSGLSYSEGTIPLRQNFFFPFASGAWQFSYKAHKVSKRSWIYEATLVWQDCKEPVEISGGRIEFAGVVWTLPNGTFPSTSSGTLTTNNRHGYCDLYKVTIELDLAQPAVEETASNAARFDAPHEPDVCLVFTNGRKLYVSPTFLKQLSSYWSDRLAAIEFSDAGGQEEHDDSDDEADKLSKEDPTEAVSGNYRELGISSFSYSTYRAFLAATQSVSPTFAPFVSSYRLLGGSARSVTAAKSARAHDLKTYQTMYPSLPLPISPKSLYRLAHFLEVHSLKKVALDGIKSRLTVDNVAFELFSPFTSLYDDVAAVEFE